MKKFISYILLVFVLTLLLDVAFRIVVKRFFLNPRPYSRIEYQYKYATCTKPAELVILGASRAAHHYNIRQIIDSLNISAFNFGTDGQSIQYQYLTLLKAIKNGSLKTVILDLAPNQMIDEWVEENMTDYYPYYWDDDSVREVVREVKGHQIDLLMLSSFIQYNSKLSEIVSSSQHDNGYIPLPYSGKKAAKKTFKQNDYQINPIAKQYLKKIAYQCKIHGISFVVCMSPLYSTRDLNYDSIKDLCKKYTIKVWDMRESISDPLLFKDATHLNERGAIQFTSKLINKLKKLNTPYT